MAWHYSNKNVLVVWGTAGRNSRYISLNCSHFCFYVCFFNYLANYRCTLVPRLPFLVSFARGPLPVSCSSLGPRYSSVISHLIEFGILWAPARCSEGHGFDSSWGVRFFSLYCPSLVLYWSVHFSPQASQAQLIQLCARVWNNLCI